MSSSILQGHLREAAILTRAVENVLRKLIRLLIGRISLTRLQEMIRLIFVQEAEAFLEREKPGKNVPLTKLALLTGLDTRTLGKVKEESPPEKPVHKNERFLREITPECSILDFWQVNPKYVNQRSGEPLILNLKGARPSFESLVAETLTSRGLTTTSILERLEATRSIRINKKLGKVEMLERRFWPFHHKDDSAMLEIGLITLGNLADTIKHNMANKSDQANLFYHRSTWTNRLNLVDRPKLREKLRDLLGSSENSVTEVLASLEQAESIDGQVTAGACLFYFEDETE